MEVIGVCLPSRKCIGSAYPRPSVVISATLRAVNCAVDLLLFIVVGFPNILHDVNLATTWPTNRVNVCAQHPESGPNSLPAWDLDVCLDAPVSPRPLPFGQHADRKRVV